MWKSKSNGNWQLRQYTICCLWIDRLKDKPVNIIFRCYLLLIIAVCALFSHRSHGWEFVLFFLKMENAAALRAKKWFNNCLPNYQTTSTTNITNKFIANLKWYKLNWLENVIQIMQMKKTKIILGNTRKSFLKCQNKIDYSNNTKIDFKAGR